VPFYLVQSGSQLELDYSYRDYYYKPRDFVISSLWLYCGFPNHGWEVLILYSENPVVQVQMGCPASLKSFSFLCLRHQLNELADGSDQVKILTSCSAWKLNMCSPARLSGGTVNMPGDLRHTKKQSVYTETQGYGIIPWSSSDCMARRPGIRVYAGECWTCRNRPSQISGEYGQDWI
jgi:hypothetical protein